MTNEIKEWTWEALSARLQEEREREAVEARAMVRAFESIGVGSFGVTCKSNRTRTPRYRRYSTASLLSELPELLSRTAGNEESLIIRPFYVVDFETRSHAEVQTPEQVERVRQMRQRSERGGFVSHTELRDLEHPKVEADDSNSQITAPTSAIVQIDDIGLERARALVPYSFCITETSPGNYQAFVCVSDCTDYEKLRRGINSATDADKGATCAARIAGTHNNKPSRKEIVRIQGRELTPGVNDYVYPQVRLRHVANGRVVKTADLRAAGLLVDVAPKPQIDPRRFQRKGAAPRRIPSYAKSLASVERRADGEPNRSYADLLFAVTCLRWRPPLTPEEIAELLYEHSEKVAEKSAHAAAQYVEDTIQKAMEKVSEG